MNPTQTPLLPTMDSLWQQTLNWQPNSQQQQQFQQLYELVFQGNQQLNLTRITDPQEFWEKHLWDSLRGIGPLLPSLGDSNPQRVIDIGTGGGFPGIPVAIACPNWQVTLLDSTRKKVTFLETVVEAIELPNVKTLVDRAEATGQHPKYREAYDLALIRAVGGATVCAEYALPLLKPQGLAVLYRGQWTEQEAQDLQEAIAQLGGQLEQIDSFTTPLSEGVRHGVFLRKVAPTPTEFPRPVGVPAQKPL